MLHRGVITGTRPSVRYRHGGVGIGFRIDGGAIRLVVIFHDLGSAVGGQYEMLRRVIKICHFGVPPACHQNERTEGQAQDHSYNDDKNQQHRRADRRMNIGRSR